MGRVRRESTKRHKRCQPTAQWCLSSTRAGVRTCTSEVLVLVQLVALQRRTRSGLAQMGRECQTWARARVQERLLTGAKARVQAGERVLRKKRRALGRARSKKTQRGFRFQSRSAALARDQNRGSQEGAHEGARFGAPLHPKCCLGPEPSANSEFCPRCSPRTKSCSHSANLGQRWNPRQSEEPRSWHAQTPRTGSTGRWPSTGHDYPQQTREPATATNQPPVSGPQEKVRGTGHNFRAAEACATTPGRTGRQKHSPDPAGIQTTGWCWPGLDARGSGLPWSTAGCCGCLGCQR
jgi:hypothetical protein